MTREEASYILRKFYANGYRSNDYTTIEQALQLAVMCLENSPRWISVEDELPTCNVFVLTCDGQGNTNLLMLAGNSGWYDHSVAKHRNITHWMPMPSIETIINKQL